jgi:hypothetical protein
MIRRKIRFSYRDNPEYNPTFGIDIFHCKYILKNEACFEVILEDGTKQSYVYADSGECRSDFNQPRYNIERRENKTVTEEVFLNMINDLKRQNFYAQEKYISLFLNRKIDKLLLNRHRNNKYQKKKDR